MIEKPVRTDRGGSAEENLRMKLARADALAGTVQPILRHLLDMENAAIFGDEILARVRGMAAHLARQLTDASPGHAQALTKGLLDDAAVLGHLHALAIEWQWTERLEQRFAIDPVMPPLMQALIASPDPATKAAGTKLLSAQARWCQAQRRMQVGLEDLPGEQLQAALVARRSVLGDGCDDAPIRAAYDEGASRLALTARLVTRLGTGSEAALELRHAGVALFASALALGSGEGRDAIVLALHEGQVTRLALALRAAGLSPAAIGQQILVLHPDGAPPFDVDDVSPAQASAILASAPASA